MKQAKQVVDSAPLAIRMPKKLKPIRIGIFSDTISVPPKEGISVHVYELLRYIALKTSHEAILFMCDRGMMDVNLFKKEPFTTVLLTESEFFSIEHTKELIRQYGIDVAQTHKTYIAATVLGEACRQLDVPMIAEFHDLEQDVLPLYFTHNDRKLEVRKHVGYQHKAAAYAECIRVMSKYDYEYIQKEWPDYDQEKFVWLPVATEAAQDQFALCRDRRVLTYVGNMSYAPNAEGADAVISMLLDPLSSERFCFIGRGSEVYRGKNLEAYGMIDSLEPYLKHTAVGLAPIFSGSGMKIKNLTYLKHGIPVITTTVGAQGYPISDAIIIENDLTKWPDIINRLLNDRSRLELLSKTAKKLFNAHFSEQAVNLGLLERYELCCQQKPRLSDGTTTTTQESIDPHEMYWLREFREHFTSSVTSQTVIRGSNSRLVVIEGLPGAGKSALLKRLHSKLGLTVIQEILPVDNTSSTLPTYVLNDTYKYAQAAQSRLTVMDRGFYSTIAVENALGNQDAIRKTRIATDKCLKSGLLFNAELIILLDINPDISKNRQNKRNAPMWREDDVLSKVSAYYNSLKQQPNVIVVDSITHTEDEVYECVKVILKEEGYL